MNHITRNDARARRLQSGLRLIDVAIAVGCAPATTRSFEFGATMRPTILKRLDSFYGKLPSAAGDGVEA